MAHVDPPVRPSVLEAAYRGAAVFAAPDLGTFAVTGRDRKTWLNGLVTCDVARVAPGAAAYGLVLVKVGRIQSDAFVLDAGEALRIGVPRDRVAWLREHFEKHLVMEDAICDDQGAAWEWVLAHGPRAAALAAEVAPAHDACAGAVDVTGLGGAAIAAPAGRGEAVVEDIVRRGGGEAVAGTADEWDALRVERGLGRFGVDFGDQSLPHEASLERRAVSFQKGCYLGQEVVCMVENRGHAGRRLILLRLDGDGLPAPGDRVRGPGGDDLGAVSSVAWSARHGAALALATVKYAAAGEGKPLDVGGRKAVVIVP